MAPSYFNNIFTRAAGEIHSHTTRFGTNQNLYCKQANNNISKFSTSVSGPKIWNSIPLNIKLETSYLLFTKKFQKYFFHLKLIENSLEMILGAHVRVLLGSVAFK